MVDLRIAANKKETPEIAKPDKIINIVWKILDVTKQQKIKGLIHNINS